MNENPSVLLESLEHFDDGALEYLSKKLSKQYPNTYTYTKSLAECLLLQQGQDLPIGAKTSSRIVSESLVVIDFSDSSTIHCWCNVEGAHTSEFSLRNG